MYYFYILIFFTISITSNVTFGILNWVSINVATKR